MIQIDSIPVTVNGKLDQKACQSLKNKLIQLMISVLEMRLKR